MRIRQIAACLGAALAPAALIGGCGGSDENKDVGPRKLNAQQLVKKSAPSTIKLYSKNGQGSGVVIDAQKGLVLTNAHVVNGAQGLKARANDEPTDYTARVLGLAPCEDLSVVEMTTPPPGIKAMAQGKSASLKAGQHVTSLGYPGNAEQSNEGGASKLVFADGRVSSAKISSTIPGLGEYSSLIQHTATVNPGNSGGPLVDDYGRLVGINTLGAIEAQNQFYSITIDHAKPLVEKLSQGISLADVGWDLIEIGDGAILDEYFEPDLAGKVRDFLAEIDETDGLYVLNTRPGTSAGRANVIEGDYITAIDGTPVTSVSEVCDVFESATPGALVEVQGRYLSSAYEYDEDIQIGDSFKQNVRVPRETSSTGGDVTP